MPEVELHHAQVEDKTILRHLLELYAYDFSEYDGADVDAHGVYGHERLDHYWTDEGRCAFSICFQEREKSGRSLKIYWPRLSGARSLQTIPVGISRRYTVTTGMA